MSRTLVAPRPGEVILPGAPDSTRAAVEEAVEEDGDPISFAGELMELVEDDDDDEITEVVELSSLRPRARP